MQADLGIIITNRDRPRPLNACLRSLAVQSAKPKWVVIADLGSSAEGAAALEDLACRFSISYLQIAYFGTWNQALAFNTALCQMPAAGHVIQLDADFILHPYLLEFTQRALGTIDAMCCVPSYVDVRDIPSAYDGSAFSFGRLLSKSFGGNRLSRGGYVVLPKEWLLANRSFDEAYQGWGFEDADLWWRAEQQLTTYEEISGSLVIHQSHPRQPGSTDLTGNPNWLRYQRRMSAESLAVNPAGFGQAAVSRKVVREGIRSSSETPDLSMPQTRIRVRTRQGDRLRPAPPDDAHPKNEIQPQEIERILRASDNSKRSSISVVLDLSGSRQDMIGASLDCLASQSQVPDQVLLTGDSGSSGLAAWYSAYSHSFKECVTVPCAGKYSAAGSINEALKRCNLSSSYVLVMTGGLILHRRALQLLCLIAQQASCLLHGPVHTLPPIAGELSLICGTPWEAWAAIAHLETGKPGGWHFFPRAWGSKSSLYSESSLDFDIWSETIARATDILRVGVRCLPKDEVMFLQCPRKVDLPEIYA